MRNDILPLIILAMLLSAGMAFQGLQADRHRRYIAFPKQCSRAGGG